MTAKERIRNRKKEGDDTSQQEANTHTYLCRAGAADSVHSFLFYNISQSGNGQERQMEGKGGKGALDL